MSEGRTVYPLAAKKRLDEAAEVLIALELPRGQRNERSALTLLALLSLAPDKPWSDATATLLGITPIMGFAASQYGKHYAPNTRETVRRQTIHQFAEAGLVEVNPDDPGRSTNSPHYRYAISPAALQLLRTFGTNAWEAELRNYLAAAGSLAQRYERIRQQRLIPVVLANGGEIRLSPGKHSELIKSIIEVFAPRFTPGGTAIYVGDTGNKWGYFDQGALHALGITVEAHGKMPDVVIYYPAKEWLVLVEAVTSHGPVNSKRRNELTKLFESARPGLIYVTAFLNRRDMARYLGDISWATEVWVQESASHLIHFDGERFLGPYEE